MKRIIAVFSTLVNSGALAALAALCSVSAYADPVLWTLSDAAFTNGGTATGSFVYDADTDVYSDINIVET